MAPRKPDPLAGSWLEAITAVSGRPAEDVSEFLARHELQEQAVPARPVDITIGRIAFRGEKDIGDSPEPFDFEWKDLGPGLWLIGSDRNSTGKTSLLGMMRWLLRGTLTKSIPPPVRGWIRHAELDFLLDGTSHQVSLDPGTPYSASVVDTSRPKQPLARIQAASPEAFGDHMSDFMMQALDLFQVLGVRSDPDPLVESRVERHRWPALFAAFHVGTDYSALLGDTVMDGLPNRMLNMFAGFPHAAAAAKIAHVRSILDIRDEREDQSRNAVTAHAKATIARLEEELEGLTPDPRAASVADLLEQAHRASQASAAEYTKLPLLRRRVDDLAEVSASARRQHNADRIALRNFVEAGAASAVFRSLSPTCCPRCDQKFGADRRSREQSTMECMVCGDETAPATTEDSGEILARLQEAEQLSARIRADAEAAEEAARKAVTDAQDRIDRHSRELDQVQERQIRARQETARLSRRDLLLGMIEETRRGIAEDEERPDSNEVVIANACETVFKARLKADQDGVLSDVETELLSLLKALGVPNLTGVRFRANPQLALIRGKSQQNYSDLSIGERLRCKIALVLALMKVAHRRGVGRHPGLLFIDTPGAQEMNDADLQAMAAGLASLCLELPSLQVFVATKRVAEFQSAVPPARRLLAPPGGSVW